MPQNGRMTVPQGRPRDWLGETQQLDFSHPKIRIAALKLTQSLRGDREKAVALHDLVRRMPFGAFADFSHIRASDVMRAQRGDCHSKGVLFVALCRAAGLPARLNFVRIRPQFLRGILDDGPDAMAHAIGQVEIDGHWFSSDAYVVDPLLFARARREFREDAAAESGWGIVRDAVALWDGHEDCIHQFRPADLIHDYGAYDDPHAFYAERESEEGSPSWVTRLKYAMGAQLVNRRVAKLREAPPLQPAA